MKYRKFILFTDFIYQLITSFRNFLMISETIILHNSTYTNNKNDNVRI